MLVFSSQPTFLVDKIQGQKLNAETCVVTYPAPVCVSRVAKNFSINMRILSVFFFFFVFFMTV